MDHKLRLSIKLILATLLLMATDPLLASADSVAVHTLVGETTLKATSINGSISVSSVSSGEISIFSSNCNSTEVPEISSLPPVVAITGIENCDLNLTVPVSLLVEFYSDNGSVKSTGGFPSILVRAKNGGVTINGSNASIVDAKSTNGNVRLTDVGVLGTKLMATSENGFVKLTRVSGPFAVRAYNGDITGDNLVFPGSSSSAFNNRNGDIKIKRVTVQTRGDGKSYKLTATGSTLNGRVVISRGPTYRGNRRYSDGQTVFSGVDPKASVSLRTVNGDISFLR